MAALSFKLRPAFGLGEDWNYATEEEAIAHCKLRPAFGLGEDWNRLGLM